MRIKKFVIVGGGVTGYAVAASLSQALLKTSIEIVLVELEQEAEGKKGTSLSKHSRPYFQNEKAVESLSPESQIFHETLGLDEARILADTEGAFNQGVKFINWQGSGDEFLQAYGNYGIDFNGVDFHHYYTKFKHQFNLSGFDQYSLSAMAAIKGKFCHPNNDPASVLSTITYGLHLASEPYAEILKRYCIGNKVNIRRGKFARAVLTDNEMIKEVALENENIAGDFFIDCSGSAALLMNAIGARSTNWSQRGFANRSASFLQSNRGEVPAATRIAAHERYWVKSVPLKDHSVNKIIYNSDVVNEDELTNLSDNSELVINSLAEGYRCELWRKNVVAFGEAAVNLELFLFSSMDVLLQNIETFLYLLPTGCDCTVNAREYNRSTLACYEALFDYHKFHYALASWSRKTNAWPGELSLSQALNHRIELFRSCGTVASYDGEMIPKAAWISLFIGFGLLPQNYDALLDVVNKSELRKHLRRMQLIIAETTEAMPNHKVYLEQYLRSQ